MKYHLIGIGGTGMGALAGLLKAAGHEVRGSDAGVYPPMSDQLAELGIPIFESFAPGNLSWGPDKVVVGNVCSADHVEVVEAQRLGLPLTSLPGTLGDELLASRHSIVVAGTHGKTTTASLLAWILIQAGRDPSYFVGGVPLDMRSGFRLGSGEEFVVEGDEYDSAFFDKGPKFLHYNPHFLILSNVEFDHADIYRDLDHVKASFEKLIALLPGDGLCIARSDDPNVMDVVWRALCPVQTFGLGQGAMWRLGEVKESEEGFEFEVIYKGRSVGTFKTPLFGEHNLLNLLSGIVCAVNLGVSVDKIRPVTERFQGARRRQEILMRDPLFLVDDFAHHPTEVRATLTAVRRRRPTGKLWAFFEPRSATSRRNVLQGEYAKAFDKADHVLIAEPYRAQTLKEEERFSSRELVDSLAAQGKQAQAFPNADAMVAEFLKYYAPGDVAVVMSNGEFGKIQEKLKRAVSG